MTYAMEAEPAELSRLGLGGGRWVLIEPPFTQVVGNLDLLLVNLQRAGLRVVLAHPERCPAFHRDPQMLRSLVDSGILTSITAGSLVGRFGGEVRRFALELMHEGTVHNVASDAHDHLRRAPGIAQELERSGFAPLTAWLTEEVPSAIINDQEIPPRPAHASSRESSSRWLPWLRRKRIRRVS
jgi:protein-tyrosine phosphatase